MVVSTNTGVPFGRSLTTNEILLWRRNGSNACFENARSCALYSVYTVNLRKSAPCVRLGWKLLSVSSQNNTLFFLAKCVTNQSKRRKEIAVRASMRSCSCRRWCTWRWKYVVNDPNMSACAESGGVSCIVWTRLTCLLVRCIALSSAFKCV